MLKMSSQIDNIVSAYKTLTKIPSIVGGKLNNAGSRVTAKWSIRNIDKGKPTKYLHNYVLDDKLAVVSESEFGIDVSNELLSAVSPSETFRAVIREEKDSKDAKKQYLEIWSKQSLAHAIDLTALDIHGDVYADSEFGNLDWSQDEKSVVYVAEKKLKKSEPYIKRKGEQKEKESDGSGEAPPKKGEEYVYRQDWGEQLAGKHLSVIVVCDVATETCRVLAGLPEGCCPGQVRFYPDGESVYGVAWETEPRRLGLIFCTNRPSFIFQLSLNGQFAKLSSEGVSVRSPRLLPSGDLIWLQRVSDGPHHAAHAVTRKAKGGATSAVVDIVETEVKTAGGASFFGVYCQGLPATCTSGDGARLLFSTPQQNEVRSYVADIDGGRIVDISNTSVPQSTSILDVRNDVILATCSNMTTPGQLYAARLPPAGQERDIKWMRLTSPKDAPTAVHSASVQYLHLEHENSSDSVKSFTALYMAPKSEGKKLPLIVWPHGGPHSGFVNAFSLEAALFAMLGFASIQVNYRGSTGAGQASVYFLPKSVGDADVKDCKLATDKALQAFPIDEKKVCLTGGSHGGFLVTHLIGQYPGVYAACVSRNPVIDVASMYNTTDIPDWLTLMVPRTHLIGQYPGVYAACVSRNPVIDVASMYNTTIYRIGLASVRINYRGSIGAGDASARCLISKIGNYDVTDCHLALTHLLERDATHGEIFLYGGSFGGFTVSHLAGRYPDLFNAMVMRNPLIDLATKGSYADNSDGCAAEAGFQFTEKGEVSEDVLLAMRRCSPLAHVHKVKTPTALMLGSGDKRVPHYQGLEYARRLKANGVPTRIYMYDDNHSLSSQQAEMDNLINGAAWFLEHLQS